MDDRQVESIIREYITQTVHLSLGTSRNNKPRVFEVHFAFDDKLNLYFVSSMNARHSQDIRDNPVVAGTIVTQHFLHQNVRAVYFEGTCEQLEDLPDDDLAVVTYEERFGSGSQVAQAARKEGTARFYKITVKAFWLIEGYDHKPAQKFELSWRS